MTKKSIVASFVVELALESGSELDLSFKELAFLVGKVGDREGWLKVHQMMLMEG